MDLYLFLMIEAVFIISGVVRKKKYDSYSEYLKNCAE